MTETLRADPGSHGVVSGVGMHMQKHAYGVWSTTPGVPAAGRPERGEDEGESEPVPIVGSPRGRATIATYSVLHGREGAPERALLVCELSGGSRCYALLDGGAAALEEAEATELIGRPVTLTPDGPINLAALG
jgi:acetyl-CoA C-acetyltransferase